MNLVLLLQQVMDYSFTPCLTWLRSAGCCVCGVANREVSKCLLEDKLCNVNTHYMVEGSFPHFFYTF